MVNKTNRLKPALIQADRDAFAALQGVAGYAPANLAYAMTAITAAQASLIAAQQAEVQAAARDAAVAREWEFHDMMLGAKDQVIAQYGKDSDEVQALGLKKKSEYNRPKSRAPKQNTPA
jgi:hypothetical protein